METKGFSCGLYRPLKEEQVRAIHEASLHILERTGFIYEPDLGDTLEMLEEAGIRVVRPRSRIFFPRDRVLELVKRAPERVWLYGRDKRHDLDLGEHRVHLGTGGCAIKVLDLETGEARPSTLRDLYQIGKLVNRHGLIGGATGTGKTISLMVLAEGFSPMGVPVFMADVKGDVAGLSLAGITNEKIQERVVQIGIEGYSLKRKEEEAPEAPPEPPAQEVLLTEIRDLLKNRT